MMAAVGMRRRIPLEVRLSSTEERPAAQGRAARDDRSRFEHFVHGAHLQVSGPWFFYVCVAAVLAWLASVPLWVDLKSWQVAMHSVASVITLLLLALLENANRRAEESSQEKLNVLAEALAALMESQAVNDPGLTDAVQRLRTAVGLEERH